jgi:hypothetical protein
MDSIGPTQSPLTLTLAAPPVAQWQLGQRLDAIVVARTGQSVTVQIGNALIEAKSSLDIALGQLLTLQVAQSGDQVVLRVVPTAAKPDTPMALPHVATSPTLTISGEIPSSADGWRIGQRLDAAVVSLMGQDKIAIKIGDALFEARSSATTTLGQRMSLEVVRTTPQIVLSIGAGPDISAPLMSALRTALPQQLPLQTAFSRLETALTSSSDLAPLTATILKQLLQQLPDNQAITRSDTLKQALQNSGQFLEHKLNTDPQPSSLDKDIKANLLRLLAALPRLQGYDTSDLSRNAEGALARIQTHQLGALAQEQSPPAWAGELPIRNGDQIDALQFHIEKDGSHSANTEEQGWNTWLTLNVRALGPLHVRISLAKHGIATTFWAESNSTADLVKNNLDYLHQALQRAGLEVRNIQCHQGRPPFPEPHRLPKGLLNITA